MEQTVGTLNPKYARVQSPTYKEALEIDAVALIGSVVVQDLQSQVGDVVLQEMSNLD